MIRYDESDGGYGGYGSVYGPIESVADSYAQFDQVAYGLPPPPIESVADSYVQLEEAQYFALPLPSVGSGVSRLGPSPSAQPRGPINPMIPAGSLFSGRANYGGSARGAGRLASQRSFTVEVQERLKRRRKRRNRFMG